MIESNTRKAAKSRTAQDVHAETIIPEEKKALAAASGAADPKALGAPRASLLPAMSTDNRGFEEEVDQADLIIPRVKLLQTNSPELKEYHDLRAGMLINSLTKEVLPATFVPVFYYKEWMRFNPREKEKRGFMPEHKPGALIWRTRDAQDPRIITECAFGPAGKKPLAITMLNFFSIFEGDSMPVIVSFSVTSYKAGKNLLSLAKLRGGAMFSRRYKLSAKEEYNEKGDYYVLRTDPNGDCDAETFKIVENYFNQFAMKRDNLKTHIEDEAGL